MSSNHRDGKDYNDQPTFCKCRQCGGLAIRQTMDGLCSPKCLSAYSSAKFSNPKEEEKDESIIDGNERRSS